MIESIRLTESEKEMLTRIKRKTGIDSWNVLCRWAYMIGLSHQGTAGNAAHEKRDAVEIKWETFSGKNSYLYIAITQLRYTVELSKEREITLFDFVHRKLSTGIRILSKSASENNLLCFSDFLRPEQLNQ